MRHVTAITLSLLAIAALCACGGEDQPVGRLTVSASQVTLPHGRLVPVELRFQPSRPLGEAQRAVVFVHLVDDEGTVVRTFDHELPGAWDPGQTLVDRLELVQSALSPAVDAGEYRLTVGIYDGGRHRWPLQVDAERVGRHEYSVIRVTVPELDPRAPRFAFSPQWLPAEAAGDRQTVARRWLSGDGALEVSGLPGPAELALRLRIPAAVVPLRLVLEPEAAAPAVRVSSDCSGFTANLSGDGFHDLLVPVPAGGRCELRFDSNFTVVEPDSVRKLSVALEQLAWKPAS